MLYEYCISCNCGCKFLKQIDDKFYCLKCQRLNNIVDLNFKLVDSFYLPLSEAVFLWNE